MSSRNPSPASFKADYELLQLNSTASWETARSSYRQLVHLWHPDKFALRPNEKAHAQQQFINLTKSYNSLRNFHRLHGRLPFESARANKNTANSTTHKRRDDSTFGDNGRNSAGIGPFARDRAHSRIQHDGAFRSKKHTAIWVASGALMMLATITFFLVLDNNVSKSRMEQGREIVRQTPQSEFTPDVEEIRKSRAREAFLKPPR